MSLISRDLQASHQIVSLLERSKGRSERILDELPGVFLVIDEDARVLRGSESVARLLGADMEEVIGISFSALFREETWGTFQSHFRKVLERPEEASEFELALDTPGTKELPYFWYVSRFDTGEHRNDPGGRRFFYILGRDISELRKAERRLNEIFASIPLGIITIGTEGTAEEKYSAHTEWLLGTNRIAGRDLLDLVFKPGWTQLKAEEKAALRQLAVGQGMSDIQFDVLKTGLPREVLYETREGPFPTRRYLGVNYQPIVYGGIVDSILIIIEDRTALVEARNLELAARAIQERTVARIIEIKRCPQEILPIVTAELETQFDAVRDAWCNRDFNRLRGALHSVKGNARIAGFESMAKVAHSIEWHLKERKDLGWEADWEVIEKTLPELQGEWNEIQGLYRALMGSGPVAGGGQAFSEEISDGLVGIIKDLFERYNLLLSEGVSSDVALVAERIAIALMTIGCAPLNALDPMMRTRTAETAEKVGKKAEINLDWGQVRADKYCRTLLSECLLHLVNNAISHGIETPEERLKAGKPETGRIEVRVRENMGVLTCEVEDDGTGIDLAKVKNKALRNKLITLEQALDSPDVELMQLILKSEFSTADRIDEVSGHGVGLSAVVNVVEKLDGAIRVESGTGALGGARFQLTMRAFKEIPVRRSYIPVMDLAILLLTNLKATANREEVALEAEPFDPEAFSGIFFGDMRRVILAITTLVFHYFGDGPVKVALGCEEGMLKCEIEGNAAPSGSRIEERRPEYRFATATCQDYLRQHSGGVVINGNQMVISFGHRIGKESIPMIGLVLEEGISQKAAARTIQRVTELSSELDIPIVFEESGAELPGVDSKIMITRTKSSERGPAVTLSAAKNVIRWELISAVETILSEAKKKEGVT